MEVLVKYVKRRSLTQLEPQSAAIPTCTRTKMSLAAA